jgi:hypothetical protein
MPRRSSATRARDRGEWFIHDRLTRRIAGNQAREMEMASPLQDLRRAFSWITDSKMNPRVSARTAFVFVTGVARVRGGVSEDRWRCLRIPRHVRGLREKNSTTADDNCSTTMHLFRRSVRTAPRAEHSSNSAEFRRSFRHKSLAVRAEHSIPRSVGNRGRAERSSNRERQSLYVVRQFGQVGTPS